MESSDDSFSVSFHSPFVSNDIRQIGSSNLIDITHTQTTQSTCQESIKHNSSDDPHLRHDAKLKEVRCILQNARKNSLDGLIMIDTLQRLGIEYHFREEIELILKSQYKISSAYNNHHHLYEHVLRNRLLRQEGIHTSLDELRGLMSKEGMLDSTVKNDVKGLMALYEASQLNMEGEDILDEAGKFSAKLLASWLSHLNPHESKIVANTLKHPYHKSLARLMVKNFLNCMEEPNDEYIAVFVEFAKMDLHMIQSIYQKEIFQITRWWEELGLAKELKFARNQLLKWHMWSIAVLTDPNLSDQRLELTKPISLVYIIDDIFDVYGTLDELILFTQAVNRWELTAANQLPKCMKVTLKALYDITDDISSKILEKYGWNPIDSLRKAWINLCNAFLVEAKWFASGQLPKAEEYLKNGIVTSGVNLVLVHMFFLLGHGLTKETVDLVDSFPGIISSTATILRLYDDLGTAKDEDQDGQDGSYLTCYMKENPYISMEGAREHVSQMINEAWKRLNKECFSTNQFSATFTKACLNVARTAPLMYNYETNHSLPSLKELMQSLLFYNFEEIST